MFTTFLMLFLERQPLLSFRSPDRNRSQGGGVEVAKSNLEGIFGQNAAKYMVAHHHWWDRSFVD